MEGLVAVSLTSYFDGKRVLLTGHTGFKGSWLALWLHMLGAEVTGLALEPEEPSLFDAAGVRDVVDSRISDIRDLATIERVMADARPEVVLHLAAQALVRASYAAPVETYATNVMGTVHVLEAARHTPSVRSVVVVTSDKCYENTDLERGYREGDPMGGADPYSSSKGCTELVTAAYRRSFFATPSRAAVASARAGNVIGGGDWAADRLVPDIVRAVAAGTPVSIRNPEAIRPWQHVLEPLAGYLMLAERLGTDGHEWAEGWNFGPPANDALTVREIAERTVARWDQGSIEYTPAADDPEEAHQLRLDASKSVERLGWRPFLSAGQAVDLTVDWYRGYALDPASARSSTESQIRAYAEHVR